MRSPLLPVDVSPLVPEAQPIVRQAAAVYLRHTAPWFIGLVAHGSALKGGFIPGCSDIDLHLYLDDAAFAEEGKLPLGLCLAIQRDLARINPAPFSEIQCFPVGGRLPAGWVGPVPGAYHVVAGRIPFAEATAEALRAAARHALAELEPVPEYAGAGLLDRGEVKLAWRVRFICTDVWPLLYHLLALREADPIIVWGLPKQRAIELLPAESPPGEAIRRFHEAVRRYYPSRQGVEEALAIIEAGVAFRRAAKGAAAYSAR